MVSIWCIIKEFLKKLGIAIGCIALFLAFICVLGIICETVAKALGPAICAAIGAFIGVTLILSCIFALLWVGWKDAKDKCEIEDMKRKNIPIPPED